MTKPREKLLQVGDPRKLQTDELLSILLGHGTSKTNVYGLSLHIANYLRSRMNNPVSIEDLTQFEGIGEVKAMQILSALELGRRYYYETGVKISDGDWDFADLRQSERQYGVHFFHHYTAKFIPQIPSRIIRRYTRANNIVVDPFMGSGTALVEAKILGCHSYGLDTNPMAIKIAQSKTLTLDKNKLDEINTFLSWLDINKKKQDKKLHNVPSVDLFEGSNLWFRSDVSFCIKAILDEIANYSPDVKNFCEVGLSTLLKGMSNARMDSVTPILPDQPIYIDRKHYYREVNNLSREISVYKRMYSQIRRMKLALLEFNKETDEKLICKPVLGDARQLNKFVDHCDLVVTSPPYWSAQNYEKIHMLSMKLFGLNLDSGREIGRNENAYLSDMEVVFRQISTILQGHFALVIGHDDNKLTHDKLFNIIKDIGFIHIDTVIRRISNQVSRAKQIKNEYIYVFKL